MEVELTEVIEHCLKCNVNKKYFKYMPKIEFSNTAKFLAGSNIIRQGHVIYIICEKHKRKEK